MRTIKFLGIAVALAVAAVPVRAQSGLQPGAFPGIDRRARVQATRKERAHQRRHLRWSAHVRMQGARRFAQRPALDRGRNVRSLTAARAARPLRGVSLAARPRVRAAVRANATPEQRVFFQQRRAQRHAVRAQVREGKLTRDEARAQLQKWGAEHRPKK